MGGCLAGWPVSGSRYLRSAAGAPSRMATPPPARACASARRLLPPCGLPLSPPFREVRDRRAVERRTGTVSWSLLDATGAGVPVDGGHRAAHDLGRLWPGNPFGVSAVHHGSSMHRRMSPQARPIRMIRCGVPPHALTRGRCPVGSGVPLVVPSGSSPSRRGEPSVDQCPRGERNLRAGMAHQRAVVTAPHMP